MTGDLRHWASLILNPRERGKGCETPLLFFPSRTLLSPGDESIRAVFVVFVDSNELDDPISSLSLDTRVSFFFFSLQHARDKSIPVALRSSVLNVIIFFYLPRTPFVSSRRCTLCRAITFSRRLTIAKGCQRGEKRFGRGKAELRIFNDRLKWTDEIFRQTFPESVAESNRSDFFPFETSVSLASFERMLIKSRAGLQRFLGFSQTGKLYVH